MAVGENSPLHNGRPCVIINMEGHKGVIIMVQRKRDVTYSCRLTEAEKADIDSINHSLGVCTTREGLIAAYRLAAQLPSDFTRILKEERSNQGGQ